MTGPAQSGIEEIIHFLVAFSLENDPSLGYKKRLSGRLTQGESATFTR